MKKILQRILSYLARDTIRKYHPQVIGITGSVGKTSAREAIFAVLKTKFSVRTSKKNFNTEIGLPLSILGLDHCGKNIFKWVFSLVKTWFVLRSSRSFPEILLLEYGIDHPGDMDFLLSIAQPSIGVVTAIGDVPVHVEFFDDIEGIIKEKTKLVAVLPADGLAVLNHDDYAVYDMKEKTKAHVLTFGFEEHAELRIENYELHTTKDAELGDVPAGITFKMRQGGHTVPFWLNGCFGKPQAYAAAAAAAVGMHFGMNFIEISEALRNYTPPPGRLRLIPGIKNSFILDDTYNAAPEAMRAALDTLKNLPGKRKIAILGDMLEIGKYSEQVHRTIGNQAADFVDLLVAVGAHAKFIADEAATRGLAGHGKPLEKSQILEFEDSKTAADKLDSLIQRGDLILVKGSQSMRMECVVEALMARPDKAGELLVRQDEYWKNNF